MLGGGNEQQEAVAGPHGVGSSDGGAHRVL